MFLYTPLCGRQYVRSAHPRLGFWYLPLIMIPVHCKWSVIMYIKVKSWEFVERKNILMIIEFSRQILFCKKMWKLKSCETVSNNNRIRFCTNFSLKSQCVLFQDTSLTVSLKWLAINLSVCVCVCVCVSSTLSFSAAFSFPPFQWNCWI